LSKDTAALSPISCDRKASWVCRTSRIWAPIKSAGHSMTATQGPHLHNPPVLDGVEAAATREGEGDATQVRMPHHPHLPGEQRSSH
jgi:hypothetical protein